MVLKIISCLLLFCLSTQASAQMLRIHWKGAKNKSCQNLIEIFLTELRTLASDRVIELELKQPTADLPTNSGQSLNVLCSNETGHHNTIEVEGKAEKLYLRYLPKARGFDANDWLAFQQAYLRFQILEPALAPQVSLKPEPQSAEILSKSPASEIESQKSTSVTADSPRENSSIFTKWWFWSLVGGAGLAATYSVVRTSQDRSKGDVTIH
ncbi:MAG: hypothetical protein AB1540_02045 [Bdellovibrionota bacterium]